MNNKHNETHTEFAIAFTENDGIYEYYCEECGHTATQEEIKKYELVKLSYYMEK